MADPVAEEVAKWRGWIEDPIRHDVVTMHGRRFIFREIDAILGANDELSRMPPSVFWDFHRFNYATTQAIAVRRQADTNRGTCSLGRLVTEMSRRADRLTRSYYVGLLEDRGTDALMVKRMNHGFDGLADGADRLDPKVSARDLANLKAASERVVVYVDEHVAHDAAEPTPASGPTFDDIHSAIDVIGEIFKKYAMMLTGSAWMMLDEPAIQEDWQAIFRVPWIAS